LKVLVLGASGMLGHKVLQTLSDDTEAYGSVRGRGNDVSAVAPAAAGIVEGVAAEEFDTVVEAVGQTRPDAIVNCIGIVKQLDEAKAPLRAISINSLFPHRLSRLAEAAGARLVHVSTDCVFSGARGGYSEDDLPDPIDLYGRSKLLGEVVDAQALTLRTSMIGRELQGSHGLLEWFLSQEGGRVRGFRRAIFSGWTTNALARVILELVERHSSLTGLWHVAAEPINKFELLELLRDAFALDVEIEPDDEVVLDRSLDGSRFRAETGITAPPWRDMIAELAEGSSLYDQTRGQAVARR
jgi:dTDP-4-dehydrorhamnose reductase